MKEATGELSMTVITIIAIVAIGGIILLLREPIKDFIANQWGEMGGQDIRDQLDEQWKVLIYE